MASNAIFFDPEHLSHDASDVTSSAASLSIDNQYMMT